MINDVKFEKESVPENYGDVINSVQNAGYTTIPEFQEGIRVLKDLEEKLRDINDDKYDTAQVNITKPAPQTDIVSLYKDAETYKDFVATHRDLQQILLDSLNGMKNAILTKVEEAANYDYRVRNAFWKIENGVPVSGKLYDVYKHVNDMISEIEKKDITLFADTLQNPYKPDSIKQGLYGVKQGRWAGNADGDTLKHHVDTLGNPASLAGATDEELALIGHAVKITIEAFTQENNNQVAINALQTAAINADGYIKARREGYTVGTDNYLTVAPFLTQTNIPAIDTIATKPDSVTVYPGLTAEAIQNIHNLYNAQLDQLQQKVDDMQSELSSYKKDDYTGKPVEQAANADTTLYGKLLAIKAAADQVAADAKDNLDGFITLYEFLNDSVNKGDQTIKGMQGKFQTDVDTAQAVATKDQWIKVYKSFQTGKDSLIIKEGETVTLDSIKLADAMAAQYGEFYPAQPDRTVDSITDGIDEWAAELQRLFGEGRTGNYSMADSQWVNRVAGQRAQAGR